MSISLSGGDKLGQYLADLQKRLGEGGILRVGFLEDATYPDGTPVAYIAAVNEFGNPSTGQPPRPFFRNMIATQSPGWGVKLEKVLKATDYDVQRSLGLMGEVIKDELQDSIREFESPGLAPATIAAKGFSKPLVDTGHMLNSVDYDVKETG